MTSNLAKAYNLGQVFIAVSFTNRKDLSLLPIVMSTQIVSRITPETMTAVKS